MNIGIIGLGSIGKRHVGILKKLYKDIFIYAYRSKANQNIYNESENGIYNIYSIEDFYKKNIEVVFISNPTSLHIEAALLAAKNNCHLFLEKPLSNTLHGVNELISIVNKKNLITLMGCNMRFNPIIVDIKKYVDNNLLGKPLSFNISCGSYLPDWRPWQDYAKSYSARQELGGGVVLDLIHEIDYCKWIFGNFIDIKSRIDKISGLKIETEDYADAIITTEMGACGVIHLDYYRPVPQRKIEIIFENGIINGDLIKNTLEIISKDKNKKIVYNFERNYMYEEQIKYFINSVKNSQKTFNDIEEGARTLKFALKIKNN